METIEKRVDTLEDILAQTLRTVDQTSREMREFKVEMQEFRETSQQEMQEMRAYQEGMNKRMAQQCGEFSRIIGRMAEDLVAPSIPRILSTIINR